MPDLLVGEILPIGLEQVGPIEGAGRRLFLRLFRPAHRARRRVVGDGVVAGHPGVPLLEPADRLLDLARVAQAALRDARLEFMEIGQQPLLVRVADRPILLRPRVTATEDVHLGADGLPLDDHARLLLARIARRRDADHGGPVGLSGEGLLVGAPFRIARRDQIVMAARPDLGQVRREGHAPVDDDRRAAPAPGALFQAREHVVHGGLILAIAVEDFVGLRKAVPVQDQPDHHLLAIRPMIARIAALGLRVTRALPFEVRRGQVVEVDGVVQGEERALPGGQRLLDPCPLGVQAIEVAIQRIVGERGEVRAEDVGQRRAPDPVGHGVLRGGPHQAVQRHHFRQALRPPTQPGRREDRIQVQQAPHLMAHVHGPRFPFVLGRHPVGVDREAGPRAAGAGAWSPGARGECLDRGVAHERRLSRERGMQPLRRAEPRLFRARRQRAERADDALPRALRGRDGFDEEIVVVGRAADAPGRATEIHTTRRVSLSNWHRQATSLLHLVTISARRLSHRRNLAHLRRADSVNRPFRPWRPRKLG